MSVTTGYICKKCGEPSPVGVGYTSSQPRTGDLARCACGYSVKPALRLEELRTLIREERISWGELSELQGMARYIDSGDVELLEWAGVPEGVQAIETCEDREYACCDLTPPPAEPTEVSYVAWYDAHVAAFKAEQARD